MKLHAWVVASLLVLPTFGAQTPKLTDPELAAQLDITVQQVQSLHSLGFTNEQLAAMSLLQLQNLLWEVSHPGLDKHAEEQNFRMLQMFDEHGRIPPLGLQHALEQRQHLGTDGDLFPPTIDPSTNVPTSGTPGPMLAGIQPNSWTWVGPGNIGGRVRSILIDPTFTNILYCGGVDGGVWKSTNNAVSWFPLNDFMGNLAVASLAMDPTNSNVIYAGTGEPTYNIDSIRGAGIFKSTNGGTNWTQLSSTANSSFLYVGRLAIDPNNSSVLLAATRSGIWRSVNAGTNWTQVSGSEVLQVLFHPTDSTQCLAAGYNGHAYYSTNGGVNWTVATGLPAPAGFVQGRVELAYAASSPTTVLASVDFNNGQVFLSQDGGQTFVLRNTGNSYLGSQGWYDNLIWVDPTTTNVVIVGGLDIWRSTDGGATFTDIGGYSGGIHPDQHVVVANPQYNGTTIRTIYVGDDGGVFRALDAYTVSSGSGWANLNHNLGITQFYGGAGNPTTSVLVGGTQDNGDLRCAIVSGPQSWTTMAGGDGGCSASDQTDPNYFYGEYVYLQMHRSSNGGLSANNIYSGISDAGSGSTANFIAPFALDPNNPNTMLAGGVSLWRSTNVKVATPTWTAIKPSIGSPISAIAVAPGNSDVIWVGHNNGSIYSTINGTAASPTWSLRSSGLPGRYCERIAINPSISNLVYVSFGGYNSGNIWMTPNGGLSWANISGNLPAAPIYGIAIAPQPSTLYVGTEVGIFATSNNGGSWSTGNDGPANVSVEHLFWLSNKLVAVTHGRGMFYTTPVLANFTAAPLSGAAPLTVYFTNLSLSATNFLWTFGDGHTSSLTNPANVYLNPGTYSVSLAASANGITNTFLRSSYITVTNLGPVLITGTQQIGTNLVFSFQTVGGKTYTVQYKNLLTDPAWLNLASIPGDGTVQWFTNSLVAPSEGFFRLSIQ